MSIYLGLRKTELKNLKIPKIDETKFLKKDGSEKMSGNLDLGNYTIENLKTYPENNKNATSKKYVDDETSKLLDLDGTSKLLDLDRTRQMSGDLFMGDNSIVGVSDINASNSVPSKKFVQDENAKLLDLAGTRSMTGSLKMNNQKITNLKNPTSSKDAVNLTSLKSELNDYVKKDGSVAMTAHLSLGNQKIYNLRDPTSNQDAATKKYVDDRIKFSHFSKFLYASPVKGVFKAPYVLPSGHSEWHTIFHPSFYNGRTRIDLLALTLDNDTSVTGTNHPLSVEFKLFNQLGGFSFKTPISNKNISKYRKNTNLFVFDDISVVFKDLDSNFSEWVSFQIKVALPWTGNETALYFCVNYY